ncbi:MAG: helix-turn-helix domain-containing protein [Acidibrevibacterium sp.]|uniref:helix-turn-helix domain-containing protein n=1 Tax=Acidibrevibacterium sp. TaxID=2606776 RepID=UPI003D07D94D
MTLPESDAMTVMERSSPGVGSRLAAARERMGWALPDVAATLRIREPHLRAIETGHVADLPAPAYAIGFVRSYATLLGLDPDEMARRYRAELGGEHRNTDLQFPAPVPERGVPAGAVVLLGAVIAIGAYVGWYRLSGERPAPESIAAAPDRLITPAVVPPAPPTASAGKTAMAGAPEIAASQPPMISQGASQGASQGTSQAPPEGTSAGTAAAASPAPPVSAAAPAPAIAPAPPARMAAAPDAAPTNNALVAEDTAAAGAPAVTAPAAPANVAGGTPMAAAEDTHILVRARADSWVEVRDRKGHVLLSRILHSGETWPVPNQPEGAPQLLLTTGNAGGTEIVVDGRPAPPLGAAGKVRRDVPLGVAPVSDGAPAAANSGPRSSSPAQ